VPTGHQVKGRLSDRCTAPFVLRLPLSIFAFLHSYLSGLAPFLSVFRCDLDDLTVHNLGHHALLYSFRALPALFTRTLFCMSLQSLLQFLRPLLLRFSVSFDVFTLVLSCQPAFRTFLPGQEGGNLAPTLLVVGLLRIFGVASVSSVSITLTLFSCICLVLFACRSGMPELAKHLFGFVA